MTASDLTCWTLIRDAAGGAVLPGTVRPNAVGFRTDDIRRLITLPDEAA